MVGAFNPFTFKVIIDMKYKINGKKMFKMATNTYLSVITLNVSVLNAPIKRHGLAE